MNSSATPFSNSVPIPEGQHIDLLDDTTDSAAPPQDRTTEIVPYKSPTYETEKRQGLRRANGARKLKKLSNRHLRIISLHLEGKSGEEIGVLLGCTIITVSRILNDPMAKEILGVIYKDRQGEIDALAGAAIDVVRGALLNDGVTTRERLSAVDRFTKLKDTIGKEEDTAKTAEDVVAAIFENSEIAGDANVQINIGKP